MNRRLQAKEARRLARDNAAIEQPAVDVAVRRKREKALQRSASTARALSGRYSPLVKVEAKALYLTGSYPTLADLSSSLGVSVGMLRKWSEEEDWETQRVAMAPKIAARIFDNLTELVANMKARHFLLARELIAKGAHALETLPATEIGDALRLIEAGVKLERSVLGAETMPTTVGSLSGDEILAAYELYRERFVVLKPNGDNGNGMLSNGH